MYLNTRTLHEPCTKAIKFEYLRESLLNRGEFKKAFATYLMQKSFLFDENSAKFWDSKFKESELDHPMEDWRINKVVSLIKSNSCLLNLGVGSGRLEKLLFKKKKNIDYLGTDITTVTLNRLKRKFEGRKFKKEILTDLNIDDSCFDQVLLLEVLEHIKPNETFKVLKEVHRVLKQGGTFLVSVPINEGLEEMLPFNPNSHMRIYSENILRFELLLSGFFINKVYRASSFSKHFFIKHMLNRLFSFRQPNNIIYLCTKK